jgi:hypothetical protein
MSTWAAENRIPKGQLKAPRLADGERTMLGEIGHRLDRKVLGEVATTTLSSPPGHPGDDPRMLLPGIATLVGNRTFRATGMSAYVKKDDVLEHSAVVASNASTRTTGRDEFALEGDADFSAAFSTNCGALYWS